MNLSATLGLTFVLLYKASFEGYGKVDNAMRGTIEATDTAPVSSEIGLILANIFNLSIDYNMGLQSTVQGSAGGNWITGQMQTETLKYAQMMLERTADILTYFGNSEFSGIVNVNGITPLPSGWVPLMNIKNGSSTTKGAFTQSTAYKFDY